MPTGKFALSGFRIFGNGNGSVPEPVKQFVVLRTEKDKRSAFIKWSPVTDAYAYNLYYGTAPDKLYTSIMVMGNNEYWLKTLDNRKTYYFTLEAINENGVSKRYETLKVE
jgi:hypothetical protein